MSCYVRTGQRVEKIICKIFQFRSISVAWKATQSLVGLLVQPGDDSELPPAMTQLLITYHMLLHLAVGYEKQNYQLFVIGRWATPEST